MADVRYHDDPTIPDEAEIWRRIPPWHFYHDDTLGRMRPTKAAFDDDPDGEPMSAILATEAGDPTAALAGHEGFALAAVTAGVARQCGLMIVRDPLPEEPAHVLIVGHKTAGIMRRLARAAQWVVLPTPHAR